MTERPLFRQILVAILLLGLTPAAALADVITSVNQVRTQGCPGHRGAATTLRQSARLNAVARQLARGVDLKSAQNRAGYRALAAAAVQISGVPANGDIRRILSQQFCAQATQPQYREIGTFQHNGAVWIALAQPFVVPDSRDAADFARRVLALTNQARSQPRRCGLTRFAAAAPLLMNDALERAARQFSQDMARHGYMDHTGRDGSSPADRITRSGYRWSIVGENLASGTVTPEETVAGWLHSPHHCANLMEPRFTQMGVAFAVNTHTDAGIYWAQEFGAPRRR